MLLSPKNKGLNSLLQEVKVFKVLFASSCGALSFSDASFFFCFQLEASCLQLSFLLTIVFGSIFAYNLSFSNFATPSACYRGPKAEKCPKWLGEGAKDLLGQGHQSPLALVQKRVAPVQNRV